MEIKGRGKRKREKSNNTKEKLKRTTTIHHDAGEGLLPCRLLCLLLNVFNRLADMLRGEVGSPGSAAEDDMHILVSASLDDGG